MKFAFKFCHAVVMGACLAMPLEPVHAAEPVRIEAFFSGSAFAGASISPNGRYLAARVAKSGGRLQLGVIDLVNGSVQAIAGFTDMDVSNVQWVNDERLVYSATDRRVGQGDARHAPGLWAVNRDGTERRQLVDYAVTLVTSGESKALSFDHYLYAIGGRRNSDFVHVYRPIYSGEGGSREMTHINLFKLNTRTGQAVSVERPSHTHGFAFDHDGEPRLAVTYKDRTQAYHYRDPATGKWRELLQFDAYKNGPNTWSPAGFAPDGTLYAVGRRTEDKTSLYRINLANGQLDGAPVVALEDFDFRGGLVIGEQNLLGIRYVSDAPATIWLDPELKKIQQDVDAILPSTINSISKPLRPETPYVMVYAASDRQPGVTFLYDTSKKSLSKLGESRPGIKAELMATQEFIKVKARDGQIVPTWLTIPNGSSRKNLPLFVMVHGGPWVDGTEWGWSGPGQFLASRGYAVLEPDFRGTLGYGDKHYRSSFKQWGLAMQDDVADAVRWAIKEGIADPKRICIGGASYGGYATLMGLVNDPDLYKCGVNWVGVTDINLMYTDTWSIKSDMGDNWKKHGMPEMIGDQVKDAEQLRKTSPIDQAARITQPILMAYGAADLRVPLFHGQKFEEAVKKTNPHVEMVVYPEEGHGWVLRKNQLDWWKRVEAFLNQHIGSKP